MRTFSALLTAAMACLFISQNTSAQSYFGPQVNCDHSSCGLEALEEDQFSYIAPPAGFEYGASRDATISVTYNNFPSNAQNAFQFAVDIWASLLDSDVPITIVANWSNLGGSVLGFAGANDYEINFSGAPLPNKFYPAALANSLAGFDLNPGTSDISCTFNSNTSWYFGVDGNTPGGQFDFVSVVLHELGHGLGCIGGSSYNSGTGTYGFGGTPVIWDFFIENLGASNLSTFPSPSTALGSQLTGNNLYWDGNNGVDGLNGTRPRIYAPSSWNGGSSYSHLNEGSYGSGNENSLMTPFIGSAEAIHTPGPAMLGMFEDMGWQIGVNCDLIGPAVTNATLCDPETGTFDLTIEVFYENPPEVGFLSVNSVNYPITGSPQEITQTYPADGEVISMNLFFTAEGGCTFEESSFYTAPPACCASLRIMEVTPSTEQFILQNVGTCTESFGTYRVCSDNTYSIIQNLTLVSGSLTLGPGESATFEWPAMNPDIEGSDLAVFIPFGLFTDPLDIRDYVQWGDSGNGGESVAESAGIWTAGEFITDFEPFVFNGTAIDYGVSFWSGVEPPCSLEAISAGGSTGCHGGTNEFTQDVIVEYSYAPETGSLNVNGQLFDIGSSPQTVTLTGLDSDGNTADVTAFFTDDPACTLTESSVFTAPGACPCAFDLNNDGNVAINDLTPLLADYGCSENCSADLTGDGQVTVEDVSLFLQFFGTTCP